MNEEIEFYFFPRSETLGREMAERWKRDRVKQKLKNIPS